MYESKNKFIILIKAIFRCVLPIALIIISIMFLNETGNLESTNEDKIIYMIIEGVLILLDFIAVIIIINTIYNLLIDLGIIKQKQHKIKIK